VKGLVIGTRDVVNKRFEKRIPAVLEFIAEGVVGHSRTPGYMSSEAFGSAGGTCRVELWIALWIQAILQPLYPVEFHFSGGSCR
jgi:hypothetical protein